ncbi:MAG: S46 family peptidase [Bacteroidales bacterium]
MKRFIIICFTLLVFIVKASADEGMWLPLLIKERISDMQKSGFKLDAKDLYSVNEACLKDAIVHFGSGCTGELISDKGLLITNHHCGFSQIQSHSSVEHDYLRDGFWALKLEDELQNKGLSVKFLIRMEDVTESILKGYQRGLSESERVKLVDENSKMVVANAIKGTHYQGKIESLYYGNQYFLFVYETYTDVRLVGAPPSSIGKFGGDTDNWMWPRHTGDFSLFRIYAGKDNKPAPYSKDNVPYKPKKFFNISLKGVNEGDFTLVYGYPGRTQKYIHSEAVRYISDISNPHKIKLRTYRLNVQNEEMAKSQEVRIKYASKNASVSNSWKKWQGEAKGIKRLNTIEKKKSFEKEFERWAISKPAYKEIINKLEYLYKELELYSFAIDYHNEAIMANEIIKLSGSIIPIIKRSSQSKAETITALKQILEPFYKDYYLPIDRRSFELIVGEYFTNVPADMQPEHFKELIDRHKTVKGIADYIFSNSILISKDKMCSLLNENFDPAILEHDPAVEFYIAFNDFYNTSIKPKADEFNREITLLYRDYMKGQMEFNSKGIFYPDANSTLRITYGVVKGYKPADAVYYKHLSTLEGIMEKDNPQIYDYNIPQKLRDVYSKKDYGKWVVNGTVPVCFIATNHTSGGNSGSPVINAKGELVGINFDRVWEGTMSDIVFDEEVCRNIALDIRYVLFVIDKVAGAGHLIDEMVIN